MTTTGGMRAFVSAAGKAGAVTGTKAAGAGTSTLAGLQKADTAPKPKSAGYKPGDVVEHRVFGKGTVIKATPIAGDCIVEIQFDRVGVKRTMANYAPLTKLNEE